MTGLSSSRDSDAHSPRPAALALAVMVEEDLDDVLAIEESAYPFPWTKGIFRDCLRAGYEARVLRQGDHLIAGYVLWSWGVGEAHILNLCIGPMHQRRGLGRHLLQTCLAEISRGDVDTVLLELRASNFVAESLYSSMGFRHLGRRKGYYPAGRQREDALLMAMDRRTLLKLQQTSS